MYSTISFKIPYTMIGTGSINGIGDVINTLGSTKVFIITDTGVLKAGLLEKIKPSLDKVGYKYDVFDGIEANVPIKGVEECSRRTVDGGYDLLIGVGGGSVMDATKVISVISPNGMKVKDLFPPAKSVEKVLPKILVPTTAGTGSEWSNYANVTDETDGLKKLMQFTYLWADAAIIDPQMTLGLPQKVTAETGIDVFAHAIEAYVSSKSNPIGDMFAETAIKMATDNLRLAYAKGKVNIKARYAMSVAASIAMKAAEISGTGLAHFIDSFIVSKVHISHGAALAILLPHVMEFNLIAAARKFQRIAELMGEQVSGLPLMGAAKKAIEALRRVSQDMGLTERLGDVGITEADIPELVDNLFRLKTGPIEEFNPRNASRDDVAGILKAAL